MNKNKNIILAYKRPVWLTPIDLHSEVWNLLLFYESWKNVKRTYEQQFPEEDFPKNKAHDISYLIKQARNYFKVARTSDFTVRPLLVYYGVYSLAKAVVLYKNRSKGGILDVQGHGSSADINKCLQMKSSLDKTSAVLSNKNGVFIDFNNCMRKKQVVANINGKNEPKVYHFEPFSELEGLSVTLKEIWGRLPDLITAYFRTYFNKPKCIRGGEKERKAKLIYEFKNMGKLNFEKKEIEKIFSPVFDSAEFQEVNKGHGPVIFRFSTQEKRYIPMFRSLYNSNTYYIAPLKEKLIEESSLLYLGSYILGMIVRYDPTRWVKMIDGRKDGRLYPIIKKFIELLELKFPILILNELSFSEHRFGVTQVFFEEIP